ncbi:TPA: hypothetical protein U1C31_001130 [Streptococcus suis]|nr:hypothetical protein [Streptococcus suis]
MSKLSPKPNNQKKLKTWADLDNQLKFAFDERLSSPITSIDPKVYEMPVEEIIQELEKNGYTVIEHGGSLVIK